MPAVLCGLLMIAYFHVQPRTGDIVDSLNGISIYAGGAGTNYTSGEFVRRYYSKHLGHPLPANHSDNILSWFDIDLPDGSFNDNMQLYQFTNPSPSGCPQADDIVVLKGKQGEAGVVIQETTQSTTIIRQGAIFFREQEALRERKTGCYITNSRILGWMRKTK